MRSSITSLFFMLLLAVCSSLGFGADDFAIVRVTSDSHLPLGSQFSAAFAHVSGPEQREYGAGLKRYSFDKADVAEVKLAPGWYRIVGSAVIVPEADATFQFVDLGRYLIFLKPGETRILKITVTIHSRGDKKA